MITAVILAAITGSSFLLQIIPQETDTTFIVTAYKQYLDGVKNIHEVLQESVDMQSQQLREWNIPPLAYITITAI